MTTTRSSYWLAKSVEERLLEAMVLDTLESRGVRGWKVIFSKEKGRLGYCSYATREICISRMVVLSSWKEAVDTAMHEAAHALTPGDDHGPVWKAMAEKLGALPRAKAGYFESHEHGERKTAKTNYGPVTVVLGSHAIEHPTLGEVTVVELRRSHFVAKTSADRLYKIELDMLHPSYGDPSKIIPRTVTLKDYRGRPVRITLGKSYYIQGSNRYIAATPKRKSVIAFSSDGKSLSIPAEYFKD